MKTISRDIIAIIMIGLLLRFVIAPFTMNWDLIAYTQVTAKLSSGGLMEVYQDPRSAYPPLTYWFVSFFTFLLKPLLTGQFSAWLNLNDLTAVTYPLIFRFLFLLKLPLILMEIGAALVFSSLFDKDKKNKILLLWMINPIFLYTIPAFSNVDIFPLFFIILSLYLYLKKNMQATSAFMLGIAASFKFFPLFFLPFLLFGVPEFKKKIILLIAFLCPFVLTQIPALSIPSYWNNILSGGNSSKILFAYLPIGGDRGLIYFILYYFLLFFHFLGRKPSKYNFPLYSFYVLVGIFLLSLFHVQWIIWLMPFILLYQTDKNKLNTVLVLFYLSYFTLVLLQQSSLNIGMLSPLEPTFWKLDWPLKKMIGNSVFTLLSVCHTILAGCLLWIGYQWKNNSTELES